VSGNAITEALVFGERAGYFAAIAAGDDTGWSPMYAEPARAELETLRQRKGIGPTPGAVQLKLQDLMWEHAGPFATLAVGETKNYDTSYTLTQADLDGAGHAGTDHDIDNTATADSNETGSSSDSAEVPLVLTPALTIDKAFVNVTGGDGDALADAVGDVLLYSVVAINTGNVTLTGVTVVDPLTGLNESSVTLAPGATEPFNTTYTLTQADLDGQGRAAQDLESVDQHRGRCRELVREQILERDRSALSVGSAVGCACRSFYTPNFCQNSAGTQKPGWPRFTNRRSRRSQPIRTSATNRRNSGGHISRRRLRRWPPVTARSG
jgi:uncharacterized repeat protein (TIGR01451 family)